MENHKCSFREKVRNLLKKMYLYPHSEKRYVKRTCVRERESKVDKNPGFLPPRFKTCNTKIKSNN